MVGPMSNGSDLWQRIAFVAIGVIGSMAVYIYHTSQGYTSTAVAEVKGQVEALNQWRGSHDTWSMTRSGQIDERFSILEGTVKHNAEILGSKIDYNARITYAELSYIRNALSIVMDADGVPLWKRPRVPETLPFADTAGVLQ